MKEIICHQFLISEFDIRKSQWGRREQLSGAHVWVNCREEKENTGKREQNISSVRIFITACDIQQFDKNTVFLA